MFAARRNPRPRSRASGCPEPFARLFRPNRSHSVSGWSLWSLPSSLRGEAVAIQGSALSGQVALCVASAPPRDDGEGRRPRRSNGDDIILSPFAPFGMADMGFGRTPPRATPGLKMPVPLGSSRNRIDLGNRYFHITDLSSYVIKQVEYRNETFSPAINIGENARISSRRPCR